MHSNVFIFIVHKHVLQRLLVNYTEHARKCSRLDPKGIEVITPTTRGCTSTRIANWKRTGCRRHVKPVVNSKNNLSFIWTSSLFQYENILLIIFFLKCNRLILFYYKYSSLSASVKATRGMLKLRVERCSMWNADPGRKQTLVLAMSVSLSLIRSKNKNKGKISRTKKKKRKNRSCH